TGRDDLTGRRVIVTGANSGLGLESVRALARAGAVVVLAVRDPARGAAAVERLAAEGIGDRLTVARLDLADLTSVREFAAAQVVAGPLDILMNNAGLMLVPKRELTSDGFELQMGVNHLGHFALTALLLPALQQATAARVVSLSSIAAGLTGPLDPRLGVAGRYAAFTAYAQSKLACALFGFELDRRLKAAGSSVTSVVAHPGYVATALFTRQQHPSLSDRLTSWVTPVVGSRPAHGARSQLRAATDRTLTGGEFIGPALVVRGRPVRQRPPGNALDRASASLLWDLSATMTETDFPEPLLTTESGT
ncbi:MAG: SDR family NAD(P)-dependent oxidoreductase, partial [Propionibacteriaceae bacterium]